MAEQKKINGTEEQKQQFIALAKEVYPLVEQIREALEKSSFGGSASVSIGDDGYMEFHPYDCGWRLAKYRKDDSPVICFEYREEMKLEEDK